MQDWHNSLDGVIQLAAVTGSYLKSNTNFFEQYVRKNSRLIQVGDDNKYNF